MTNSHLKSNGLSEEIQGLSLDADSIMGVRTSANWDCIAPTVEFVRSAVGLRGSNDQAQRAALVMHELLENAVKYGGLGDDVEIEVKLSGFVGFELRVTNRAVNARVNILQRELERIGKSCAADAFSSAVKRAATFPQGTSMIGLSRVAHEGRVTLSLRTDGKRVQVVAKGK